MGQSPADLEQLFNAALERNANERAAFLDSACAGDTALRRRVESLLSAHGKAAQVMPGPLIDNEATRISPAGERAGTMIGPYKLQQLIGEGGFGAVYMAEQEKPVRRKVALKIIKLGMDTRQVIARFEAERQALALMDHINIARVLDAGATDAGRPYFVMELVRGVRITEYCDKNKLSARGRLELFIQICRAVQHAHQKGVIHRDLKPSNILVTLNDGVPVPKVIDFGIAKATSQRLTDKTLFTEFQQFIGTPEYMSPEQAEMSGLDIDTRTDIYALGVLLYELLTGATPVDGTTLRKAGFGEIQRMIRELEPVTPSTRLSGTGDAARKAAELRGTDPAGLRRMLRGDLDWIVMKAIEKDRTRRYPTALELCADVERYLRNEPVLAGPPGARYKLQKFVARHRGSVLTAGMIAAALLIGCALAVVGFVQARRERDEAFAARTKANEQARLANEARTRADQQAARADEQARHFRRVSEFLQRLIARVDAGDSDAAQALDEVVQRGRELFGDDHAIVASLLTTRAAALNVAGQFEGALSAYERALDLLRSASEQDQAAIAAVLSQKGALLKQAGELRSAETVLREALLLKRRVFGPDHRMVADAEALLLAVLNMLEGTSAAEIHGLWKDALRIYEQTLGPEHLTTVRELCAFVTWLYNAQRIDDAKALLPEAVQRARRVLPDDEYTRFFELFALAMSKLSQDKDDVTSAPLYSELEKGRDPGGASAASDAALGITMELAGMLSRVGRREAAIQQVRQYLAARRGNDRRSSQILILRTWAAYGVIRGWLHEYSSVGRDLIRVIVADGRAIYGADSDTYLDLLRDTVPWLVQQKFDAEVEPLLGEMIGALRQRERFDELCTALIERGEVLTRLKRHFEAEPLLREALALRAEHLPPTDLRNDVAHALAASALGNCLLAANRLEEAETQLLAAIAALDAADAPHEQRKPTVARLALLYETLGRPEDAARWRARLESGGQ